MDHSFKGEVVMSSDPGFDVCAICGKQFWKPASSLYKVKFAGKTYKCCYYKCYRIAQQTKEQNIGSRYKKYMDAVNSAVLT